MSAPASGDQAPRPDGVVDGLVDTARALAAGTLSAGEATSAALDRIAAAQPILNAFRLVRDPAARQEAAEADRCLAAGDRAPLLGVPVAVKDDTETAGDDTRFGTHEDVATVPGDAQVVTRLRDAGAVVVGKTTTCEFGQWPFTAAPTFGHTRNPWDHGHTPGGSSGGSAAAVAAGLVPAALGSDGAGSIRIPAAWTHLVGIKPPTGMVPIRGGALGFNGLTVNGPLARTVEDAALLLDVVAGTGETFRRAAATTPGRLRMGVALDPPFTAVRAPLDPQVGTAVRRLAGVLDDLGHDVVDVAPSYGPVGMSFLPRSLTGVRAWSRRVDEPGGLDPRTRGNARMGAVLRGPALAAAMRARGPLRRRVGHVFEDVDVLLVPTTATPPPVVGAFDGLPGWRTDLQMTTACPYAWAWNVLGWPGVNVPAGRTRAGLPVGAQLLGPGAATARLVSVAAQLQHAERWPDRWPSTLTGTSER